MKSAGTLAIVVFAANAAIGFSQTMVDLSTQSKNIDFSKANATKPFKTGTALPPTCREGEVYLKIDAPAGRNVYTCLTSNTWAAQSSGDASMPGQFSITQDAAAQITIGPGSVRFGTTVFAWTGSGVFSVGQGSGTMWIYGVPGGAIVGAHNLGSGAVSVVGDRYGINELGTGFPAGSVPIVECAVLSGQISECIDKRAGFAADAVVAGPSGSVDVDCSDGVRCKVDVSPTLLPTYSGVNAFTGLNTFERLRVPAGTTLAAAECDEATEAGKVFVMTDAPAGPQLYICGGASGWQVQASGGSGSSGIQTLSAGPSGLLEVNCPSGTDCQVDAVGSLLPLLGGTNVFTGMNTFDQLRIPAGTTLLSTACDEASEAGMIFVKTDAPAGQQLYVCEGAAGWRIPAAQGGGTTAELNAAYVVQQPHATVPNAQALSSLPSGIVKNTTGTGQLSIAVAGQDYYQPGSVILMEDLPDPARRSASYDDLFLEIEDFCSPSMTSNSIGKLGWALTSLNSPSTPSYQSGDSNHPCVFRLGSGTVVDGLSGVHLLSTFSVGPFTSAGTTSGWEMQAILKPNVLNEQTQLYAGLITHANTRTPANAIWARYDSTSPDGSWILEVRSGGSVVGTVQSTKCPVASSWSKVRIRSVDPGIVRVSIADAAGNFEPEVTVCAPAVGTCTIPVAPPNADLGPTVMVGTTNNVLKTVDVDRIAIQRVVTR